MGGADGFAYDVLKHFYASEPSFDPVYDVVDTTKNLEMANSFGCSDRKRFYDKLSDCSGNKYGLAIATGMIHLIPDPRDALAEFFSHDFEYAFIGRCPIMPLLKKDRLAVFNSGKNAYPCYFFASDWRDHLMSFGDLVFELKDYDNPSVVEKREVFVTSYLVKKKQ